jgi:hypothetical protein
VAALVLALVVAAVVVLLLVDKLYEAKASLRSERESAREERERLAFDLALARALAREGTVYLVESADPLIDASYWRPHTFFLDEGRPPHIVHRDGIPVAVGLSRVRKVTADDLPRAKPL